jgi:hypothetical protein
MLPRDALQGLCRENTRMLDKSDSDGIYNMLYDRTFGGYYSVYQHYEYRKHGPGMYGHYGNIFQVPLLSILVFLFFKIATGSEKDKIIFANGERVPHHNYSF